MLYRSYFLTFCYFWHWIKLPSCGTAACTALTEEIPRKLPQVPRCPLRIPHRLPWGRTTSSAAGILWLYTECSEERVPNFRMLLCKSFWVKYLMRYRHGTVITFSTTNILIYLHCCNLKDFVILYNMKWRLCDSHYHKGDVWIKVLLSLWYFHQFFLCG